MTTPFVESIVSTAILAGATIIATGGTAYLQTHNWTDSAVVGAVAAATWILGNYVKVGVVASAKALRS